MAKLNIKKIAALGCAAAMLGSLTACGENTTWGAVIDGEKVPAGVFIYYLETAHYEAQTRVNEEASSAAADLSPEAAAAQSAETVTAPLFSSQIDGIAAKEWIYNEATEYMQEYIAVENKFDEYGLTLSDEDKETAQVYLDQMWEYAGDYYTEMGISQESYKSIFLNSSKKQKLFEAIYGEGGEKAVSDDEIKAYLDENYALINYIEAELRDGDGNLLKSEGKAERMEMLNGYMERFKNGEDFDMLNAEYNAYYDELKAAAQAAAAEAAAQAQTDGAETAQVETSPAEAPLVADTDEISDSDGAESEAPAETEAPAEESVSETSPVTEAVTEAVTTAVSETAAAPVFETVPSSDEADTAPASNKTAIEKADGTTPCPEVAEKVFSGMNKGDIAIVETANGEYYYLVAKLDILADEEYYLSAKPSLLSEMKSEEFEALIAEWTAAQTVSKNTEAYNRYDPQKIFQAG